jgi:hypothetical protein
MNTSTIEKTAHHKTDVCCPEFHPDQWNNKKHIWNEKLFIKGIVPEFFHIPLPVMYGNVITKLWKKANDADAAPALEDFLLLAYDPSPFKGELLLHVTHEIPGEQHVYLSGIYMTKVFDGPYNQVPKYMKEMNGYLASHKMKAKKHYFYYAYCPKCAKKYGHNYIVDFAEV